MGTQDRVAEQRMGLPRKQKEGEEEGMEKAEGSVQEGPETRLGRRKGSQEGHPGLNWALVWRNQGWQGNKSRSRKLIPTPRWQGGESWAWAPGAGPAGVCPALPIRNCLSLSLSFHNCKMEMVLLPKKAAWKPGNCTRSSQNLTKVKPNTGSRCSFSCDS